eukprot:jgi/Picsp_1/5657/NSC_03016-R1_hypothetical protein COCSUDRAFT_63555 [Coccomyxa subellipsoidea C-169]
MDGKGRQSVSPDRVLSPSNPFQSALDRQNELQQCLNVGQTCNPFARREHVPCATLLSTMNGPNRKRSPEDTSTAMIRSFFKSRSINESELNILRGGQTVEQQPMNGVVERSHVPRKTVQVSLASLQARKQHAGVNKTARMNTKVRNSVGPIDLESDLERFHQSVAYSSQQSGGMQHFTTKNQWRTSANGFKPPRVVDPDAHRKFLSRHETWKEGGSGGMESQMKDNKPNRTTKQGESQVNGLMENRKEISGGEAKKLPAVFIEEINLVDDDDDDLAGPPCRGKALDSSLHSKDLGSIGNDSSQRQVEKAFPSKSCQHSSQYKFKGTGVAIFDEFSSEYCDSDDGWDEDEYGPEYEEEIAGTEWDGDNSHQEDKDTNVGNLQSFSKLESRLENATIMVDGQCQPWWKRLDDFVPISALRSGYDPRDGSKIHIDYMGQFKGTKSQLSDDVGTGVKKKRARTTKTDADGHWVTEDGVKSFVTNDGNRLTGKAAYAAYLTKKQGKKPTKKRRSRTKKTATKRKK